MFLIKFIGGAYPLNHQEDPELEALSSIGKSGARVFSKLFLQISKKIYKKNFLKSDKEKYEVNNIGSKRVKMTFNRKKGNQNSIDKPTFSKVKAVEKMRFLEKKQEVILKAKIKNNDLEIKLKNKIQTKSYIV